jgi:hypothetical protein
MIMMMMIRRIIFMCPPRCYRSSVVMINKETLPMGKARQDVSTSGSPGALEPPDEATDSDRRWFRRTNYDKRGAPANAMGIQVFLSKRSLLFRMLLTYNSSRAS